MPTLDGVQAVQRTVSPYVLIRSSAAHSRRASRLPRTALPLATLIAVLLPAAPVAWAAPVTPSIAVSPTTGASGAALTVSGAGWPAGDVVQVQIGGLTVCQLPASAQESVSGDQSNGCRVPPGLSAGSYALTAADLMNGSEQATGTSFTIPAGPLLAAFNPTLATVLAGSILAFDASGSSDPGGDITSYSWSFGDGTSATGVQTNHTYLNVGTFPVTLTIADGSATASVTHPITVIAQPPVQTLILTPVAAPTIVTFARVSTTRSGVVSLGKRLFCPGAGPGCTALVQATSTSLAPGAGASPPRSGITVGTARAGSAPRAGGATLAIGPNQSAAVTFKLSKRALAQLRRSHHIPARVKIVVVRGDRTTISNLSLTLRLR